MDPVGLVGEGRLFVSHLSEGFGRGHDPRYLTPFHLISGGRVDLTLTSNSLSSSAFQVQ